MVKIDQHWINWIREITFRIGVMEATRRLGRSQRWLLDVRQRKYSHIQRRTARRILLVLRELRAENVVRHKDSIHHGSMARGHEEKIPVHSQEFYGKNDQASEARRRWNREHPELARELQDRMNARRRAKHRAAIRK